MIVPSVHIYIIATKGQRSCVCLSSVVPLVVKGEGVQRDANSIAAQRNCRTMRDAIFFKHMSEDAGGKHV